MEKCAYPHLKIAFSGHRDRVVEPIWLLWVADTWPGATWVHGGCKDGFDAQVDRYIQAHGIPYQVIRPDYERFKEKPKAAPLVRNREIVDQCSFVVVCYDGRDHGGTHYTVKYARKKRVPVILLPPTVDVLEQLALPLIS